MVKVKDTEQDGVSRRRPALSTTSICIHNRFPIFFVELSFFYYGLFWWESNSSHLLSKMEVKKSIPFYRPGIDQRIFLPGVWILS